MDNVIPLFPLKLVVFPNSKYPLHIFEPRYKNMLEFCLMNDKGFGIVAQVGKEMSNIGCYVKISSVLKKYENGTYDIIVEGISRFSIDKIEIHDNGYFVAKVYEYGDTDPTGDIGLIQEVKIKFEAVLKKINFVPDDPFWDNFIKTDTKSFKIAEKSGLTLTEQQELLLIQDENSRLNFLKKHFIKLEDRISKNLAGKLLIMNDGFVN